MKPIIAILSKYTIVLTTFPIVKILTILFFCIALANSDDDSCSFSIPGPGTYSATE